MLILKLINEFADVANWFCDLHVAERVKYSKIYFIPFVVVLNVYNTNQLKWLTEFVSTLIHYPVISGFQRFFFLYLNTFDRSFYLAKRLQGYKFEWVSAEVATYIYEYRNQFISRSY